MRTARFISPAILSLIIFCASGAYAQDYVLSIKGDSLPGNVKAFNYGSEKKVQITGSDKKKTTIPLFQVKSFYIDGVKFVPAKGPTGYVFMKVVKEGYLSLLSFQIENQTSYDGRFLLKKDGQGVEVPNLTFKKTLRTFLRDCETVSTRIESGEFSRNDLETVIDEYNRCITGKQIEVTKEITQRREQTAKLNPWEALELKVKNASSLEGKDNALEMITEIKGKISRAEKVPNFMVDGLRNILNTPDLQPELEAALKEIK
jgi:hypothetical protein